MGKEYIVRPYQPGDEEKIVELLELVFDRWPHHDLIHSSVDHWRWKYLDTPLEMNSVSVAVSDNKVIGCNHCDFRYIKIGKKVLLCSLGMDSAVHPDYRSMGVYTKITNIINKEIEGKDDYLLYWGTGNPILIKDAERKGQPRFPKQILIFIRIKDIDLHLKNRTINRAWLKKIGYLSIKALNSILKPLNPPSIPSIEFNINKIDAFDERIDTFWDNVKGHYDFIVVKNRKYLNWRYCDSRGGDYIKLQIEEGGHILGYIVLRINRSKADYPKGYIVELLALPNRMDVAYALLEEAVRRFDEQNVNIIYSLVIRNHPYEEVLKQCGFLNSRHKHGIFYKILKPESEIERFKNSSPNRLHFQYGDTDNI